MEDPENGGSGIARGGRVAETLAQAKARYAAWAKRLKDNQREVIESLRDPEPPPAAEPEPDDGSFDMDLLMRGEFGEPEEESGEEGAHR